MYIVFVIFIIFIIYYCFFKKEKTNDEFNTLINTFVYKNENNNVVDHKTLEISEQKDAFEYIEPNDVVLELGGRYGTVSCVIAYKQNNNGNLVVVEPDDTIINALEYNKNINNANFIIARHFISNKSKQIIYESYGTRVIESVSKNNNDIQISYNDFKAKYPFNFNVIVADCEGCLCEFIEDMGNDINNVNKILFEADQDKLCEYKVLINKLTNMGFKIIKEEENEVMRYVMIK